MIKSLICSKCKGPRERAGYYYCKACHSAYAKSRLRKQSDDKERLKELEAGLERIESKITQLEIALSWSR